MQIREATLADTRRLAEVAAAAFFEDPLMPAIEPRRRQFPEDYLRGWFYSVQAKILAPEAVVLVSMDKNTDIITGFGAWKREGNGGAAEQWRGRGSVLKSMKCPPP